MRPAGRFALLALLPCVFCLRCDLPAQAEGPQPLHERIDALIERDAKTPLAAAAGDAEFLRRVYLDLSGKIPSVAEARAFLQDTSADKRARLIDRLLESASYARRMRDVFHIMLMERRGDNDDWLAYLEASFAANKPWDQMAQEILQGEAADKSLKGAPFFFAKRLEHYGQNPIDQDGLARDIGRLFLGVDLQCANCHDHLFIDDYKQKDYKGLFAFIANTKVQNDGTLSETLTTQKLEYVSVFAAGQRATGPRLPFGEEFEIPTFAKGEEYLEPPDRKKRTPGVPKFSPRKLLAKELPQSDVALFNKNIANRLWWVMMGRGLVEPLDLQHKANPPSHPELLDLLAREMVDSNYDIKAFLRQVALSGAYQRFEPGARVGGRGQGRAREFLGGQPQRTFGRAVGREHVTGHRAIGGGSCRRKKGQAGRQGQIGGRGVQKGPGVVRQGVCESRQGAGGGIQAVRQGGAVCAQ